MTSKVRDFDLAPSGIRKIEWAKKNMPILRELEEVFKQTQVFRGTKVTISVHLEAKTAYMAKVFASGGAEVAVTGSNPLSTQDDVAAALAVDGLSVYAWHGATQKEYEEHLNMALGEQTNIIIDDGGDLVNMLHLKRSELLPYVIGGCEETTTGIIRLRAMEKEGLLKFPMVAVNNAKSKYLFDNRYGTGQSVWDAINKTTNQVVAGKEVAIVGYGWCGKGVAMRAKGQGANVIVCEVDPIKAMEAHMDGFRVMTMNEASSIGEVFVTVTGCKDVITAQHFMNMKDGAVICNAGHFNVEISVTDLESMSKGKKEQRDNIIGYEMKDGRWINLLAEGRLVNLAAGDGHPIEIMDLSFALQILSAKYVLENHNKLGNVVIDVPEQIDQKVASMRLKAWGINIDSLTDEQRQYLASWNLE